MGAFINDDGKILVVILKLVTLHTQSLVVSIAAGISPPPPPPPPPPLPQARVVSMVVGLWVIMSITSWEEYTWVLMLKSHVYEGWVSSIIILSSLKQINIRYG